MTACFTVLAVRVAVGHLSREIRVTHRREESGVDALRKDLQCYWGYGPCAPALTRTSVALLEKVPSLSVWQATQHLATLSPECYQFDQSTQSKSPKLIGVVWITDC